MASELNMELIQQVIDERMAKDREKWGAYNSPHEGWAVIKEEVQEASLEMTAAEDLCDWLFGSVCEDEPIEKHRRNAKGLYVVAVNLIKEAFHVAITTKKYIECCDERANQFALLKTEAK